MRLATRPRRMMVHPQDMCDRAITMCPYQRMRQPLPSRQVGRMCQNTELDPMDNHLLLAGIRVIQDTVVSPTTVTTGTQGMPIPARPPRYPLSRDGIGSQSHLRRQVLMAQCLHLHTTNTVGVSIASPFRQGHKLMLPRQLCKILQASRTGVCHLPGNLPTTGIACRLHRPVVMVIVLAAAGLDRSTLAIERVSFFGLQTDMDCFLTDFQPAVET